MMYFIDFDDTIFDTGRFVKDFKKIFSKHGVSGDEFEKSYIPCSEGVCGKTFTEYDLENQLLDIESRHGKMFTLRGELCKFIESSKCYVFDDFYDFVKEVPRSNIFLVSFGKSSFQKLKIENSGVLEYVHDYVLTNTSKADCIDDIFSRNKQGERRLTFIDDRPDQIKDVSERFSGMLIYRMKRPEGRYGEDLTPRGISEIKSITDIPR